MAITVYILCFATSVLCAVLLFHSYRKSHARILLWSLLCFVGLAVNNLLLVADLVVLPDINLTVVRSLSALVGVALMSLGFAWDARR